MNELTDKILIEEEINFLQNKIMEVLDEGNDENFEYLAKVKNEIERLKSTLHYLNSMP